LGDKEMPAFTAENETLSFLETLYAAAWSRTAWQDALESLSALFHASRVCIFEAITDCGAVTSVRHVNASIDDQDMGTARFVDAFTTKGSSQHPYLSFFAGRGSSIARLEEIVDLERFRQGQVWNEWMKPRDLDLDMRCVFEFDHTHNVRKSICIHRAVGQQVFSDREKHLLSSLLPHLRRAGSLDSILRRRSIDTAMASKTGIAMLVADRKGRVIRANTAAEQLLSSLERPLTFRNQRLAPSVSPFRATLGALVDEALAPSLAKQTNAMIILDTYQDKLHGPRFLVSANPVPAGEIDNAPWELALVSIQPLDKPYDVDLIPTLIRLFGLPPAQARLALRLGNGATLREAAVACGVSYGSARTYLAAIYNKTGLHHQGELVALLKSIEMATRIGR
jgi:DNA-binding CsgD family transcriptional regulator